MKTLTRLLATPLLALALLFGSASIQPATAQQKVVWITIYIYDDAGHLVETWVYSYVTI